MKAKEFVPASKPRNFVAKNQKTAGAGAHRDKKKEQKQGYEKHKGKDVQEGHTDQQKKIFKKNGKPVGEVGIDRESSPGVGQYYMKHYASGTDNSGYDSFDDALGDLRHIMKQSVYGELQGVSEGDVMEYETHRWTDDQGNEWEIDDEGNKTLLNRSGGRSGRDGYTYRKRLKPAYSKPKGYYFYNVPAGKESDARAAGLRQSKSGKWFDTMTNDVADHVFGKGRYWEPKN